MAAYVGGDAGAFRELFERYGPVLERWLRRWVRSESLVQDLVQQTFLQVHRARRDFREGASLRPWVLAIAHNLAREQGRRRLRRPEVLTSMDGWHEPAVETGGQAQAEAALDLGPALERLPPGQREVVLLHWAEGMSYREIAQVLGTSSVAVRVRAHRAYAALRKILEASNGDGEPSIHKEE